jgi:hypothetical protein
VWFGQKIQALPRALELKGGAGSFPKKEVRGGSLSRFPTKDTSLGLFWGETANSHFLINIYNDTPPF